MTSSFGSRTRSGLLLLAGLAPALALIPPAPARAASPAGLSVSGQWMRALAPGTPAAGYFTIANGADRPFRLVGASSPACGSLTLHRTMVRHTMSAMSARDPGNPAGGMPMASMQAVSDVAIPAHGLIRFAPGGYHLMCEQPTDAVQPGHGIPVTLDLGAGGSIDSEFQVRGPRG